MSDWFNELGSDHDDVRDNPVLYACAHAGMTPEQAIVELARQFASMQKAAARLAELTTAPIVVVRGPAGLIPFADMLQLLRAMAAYRELFCHTVSPPGYMAVMHAEDALKLSDAQRAEVSR